MPNLLPGYPKKHERPGVMEYAWVLTSEDPVGVAAMLPDAACTWHVTGHLGTAQVMIDTSSTPEHGDFAPCRNQAGALISLASLPAVVTNHEQSIFIRPRLYPAGSGATVTVHLTARKG